MILASDIKVGMAIRLDDKLYKVLEVVRHTGSGQMHGFLELKLKDIQYGHFADRHFKQADKLEQVELSKRQMQYLYSDSEAGFFMDLQTFEQFRLPRSAMSGIENFLTEAMNVTVELFAGQPVAVDFPKTVEIKVKETGPGVHGGQDSTMKPATLENGMEILVPHFVETGDLIRVETDRVKYVERVGARKA